MVDHSFPSFFRARPYNMTCFDDLSLYDRIQVLGLYRQGVVWIDRGNVIHVV
jgi:hypothetical protein